MGAEADLQNTAREGLNERKIILQSKDFWENCWQSENPEAMYACLDSYYRWEDGIIDVFRAHRVEKVCDAACGYGAYSLAFASNGFKARYLETVEIGRASCRERVWTDV